MMKYSSYNYDKYQSGNPLKKYLLRRFLSSIHKEIKNIAPSSLLDAGSGEGMALSAFSDIGIKKMVGIDLSKSAVKMAKKRVKNAEIRVMSVYDIKYPDRTFDTVIMLEVLEHLAEYEKAIKEAKRVAKGPVIFSVPDEPLFTIMSLLSGKYVSRLGRHPEHINAWSKDSFHSLIKKYFKKTKCYRSIPWTIVVAGR